MLKEFKEFALKGNLVDMAVGFVMGGAFATVVTAFIQGVFLPLLAPIMGGIDLASIAYTVTPAEMNAAGEVVKEA
ncbi:MscL family protein, partial [Hyphomonas sp. UBA3988]